MDSLTKERKLTRNLKRRFPDCWNRFIIRSLFLKVPCLPLAVLTPGLLFLEHCTGSLNSLRWVIVKGFSLCYVMALIRRRETLHAVYDPLQFHLHSGRLPASSAKTYTFLTQAGLPHASRVRKLPKIHILSTYNTRIEPLTDNFHHKSKLWFL